ncbi:unnamed protein product, partial [Pelagomonas calceolata]
STLKIRCYTDARRSLLHLLHLRRPRQLRAERALEFRDDRRVGHGLALLVLLDDLGLLVDLRAEVLLGHLLGHSSLHQRLAEGEARLLDLERFGLLGELARAGASRGAHRAVAAHRFIRGGELARLGHGGAAPLRRGQALLLVALRRLLERLGRAAHIYGLPVLAGVAAEVGHGCCAFAVCSVWLLVSDSLWRAHAARRETCAAARCNERCADTLFNLCEQTRKSAIDA